MKIFILEILFSILIFSIILSINTEKNTGRKQKDLDIQEDFSSDVYFRLGNSSK